MDANLDRVGRIVRGVIGIWLLAGTLSALRADRRTVAAMAGVAGVGLLGNALGGFCGLNHLAGIDATTVDHG